MKVPTRNQNFSHASFLLIAMIEVMMAFCHQLEAVFEFGKKLEDFAGRTALERIADWMKD